MEKTKFTLGEAAKTTGYAKSKISKDISEGKLSAARESPTSSYQIDASELIRVYPDRFKPDRLENGSENVVENDRELGRTPSQNGLLDAEVHFLREKVRLIETMKDGEIKQLNARIDDMRKSVDDAHEQRENAMRLLTEQIAVTKQLTDQRVTETAIAMPPPLQPEAAGSPAEHGRKRGGLLGLFGRRAG